MPAVKVARVPSFGPPPVVFEHHNVGPATGVNTITRFAGQLPPSGGPRRITRVALFPSVDIAANASSTTFRLQNIGGTVTYATGTNVAAITAAAGLNLTLSSDAANVAAGTVFRLESTNVVGGEALGAVVLNFHIEHQPA